MNKNRFFAYRHKSKYKRVTLKFSGKVRATLSVGLSTDCFFLRRSLCNISTSNST